MQDTETLKFIYGRELKVGDLIRTWMGTAVMVQSVRDHRDQTLNGVNHHLATAYCSNSYNITIFLDEPNVILLRKA